MTEQQSDEEEAETVRKQEPRREIGVEEVTFRTKTFRTYKIPGTSKFTAKTAENYLKRKTIDHEPINDENNQKS